MGIVGMRILVWGGETAREQRTDPSQPHLKPVLQPEDSGGLAAAVLELLLKHLLAQLCVKRCRFGLQPVLLICLYLFGIPKQREKVYGKQKLPDPSSAVWGWCSSGLTLAAVVRCGRWFPSAHIYSFLAMNHQLLTSHPKYLFLSFLKCQCFYKCRLGLGE